MTIRLGLIDCDTSHVVAFTQRINHLDIAEDHWVEGAQIVGAVSLPSRHSPDRVAPLTDKLREYGIPIYDDPKALIGKIDGALVEANEGGLHVERAMPFIEAGIPTWVDKPLACTVEDARTLVEAATRHNVPLLSASSLRWDLPVQEVQQQRGEIGAVLGVDAYTPAAQHELNPGWFNYGVHGVEILYALLGAGCRTVRCVHQEGVDFAVGEWDGGRIGTVRGSRAGRTGLGFTAFTEKKILSLAGSGYNYREALKQIIRMVETRQSPVSAEELVEVVAFQVAANQSMARNGDPISLAR